MTGLHVAESKSHEYSMECLKSPGQDRDGGAAPVAIAAIAVNKFRLTEGCRAGQPVGSVRRGAAFCFRLGFWQLVLCFICFRLLSSAF